MFIRGRHATQIRNTTRGFGGEKLDESATELDRGFQIRRRCDPRGKGKPRFLRGADHPRVCSGSHSKISSPGFDLPDHLRCQDSADSDDHVLNFSTDGLDGIQPGRGSKRQFNGIDATGHQGSGQGDSMLHPVHREPGNHAGRFQSLKDSVRKLDHHGAISMSSLIVALDRCIGSLQ